MDEEKRKKDFAMGFLMTIDTDGDGGLSLCELKAAELGKFKPGQEYIHNLPCFGSTV